MPSTWNPEAQTAFGRSGGYTLVEIALVLVFASVLTSIAFKAYDGYLDRTSARRGAEIFAQDLTLARSQAVRRRASVTIIFDEASFRYIMRGEAGDTLLTRFWDGTNESLLEVMTLDLTGDSVSFGSRGIADISTAGGSLAQATFTAGDSSYDVMFNSMGASRIDTN